MYLVLLLVVWKVLLLNTNSDYFKSLFSSLKSRYCTQNVSMSQPIKWFSQSGTSLMFFSLTQFSPLDGWTNSYPWTAALPYHISTNTHVITQNHCRYCHPHCRCRIVSVASLVSFYWVSSWETLLISFWKKRMKMMRELEFSFCRGWIGDDGARTSGCGDHDLFSVWKIPTMHYINLGHFYIKITVHIFSLIPVHI